MPAAPKAKPAKAPEEAKPTDYVVLVERVFNDEPMWHPVSPEGKPRIFSARSGALAIEQHAGKAGEAKATPGRYKAVAWSSWKGITNIPEPVQVAQQKLTIVTDE
jgi:hypothetical protein